MEQLLLTCYENLSDTFRSSFFTDTSFSSLDFPLLYFGWLILPLPARPAIDLSGPSLTVTKRFITAVQVCDDSLAMRQSPPNADSQFDLLHAPPDRTVQWSRTLRPAAGRMMRPKRTLRSILFLPVDCICQNNNSRAETLFFCSSERWINHFLDGKNWLDLRRQDWVKTLNGTSLIDHYVLKVHNRLHDVMRMDTLTAKPGGRQAFSCQG